MKANKVSAHIRIFLPKNPTAINQPTFQLWSFIKQPINPHTFEAILAFDGERSTSWISSCHACEPNEVGDLKICDWELPRGFLIMHI